MNNSSLIELENSRLKKLEEYKLDGQSVAEFKTKIKKVNAEESNKLGQELFEEVSKKKTSSSSQDELADKVIELIQNGANIEYKDEKKGDFPLLVCARKGYTNIAYILLRAGANVNQVNNYLTTATMAAARHGHKDLLQLLIILGANVNAKCFDGDNALMSAKRHGQQECFDILIKAQSHLTHKNIANQSILDIPGNLSFDLPNIEDSSLSATIVPKTEDDVLSLISEAEDKLNELNSSVKKLTK